MGEIKFTDAELSAQRESGLRSDLENAEAEVAALRAQLQNKIKL
jgi:hypothetical protein